MPSEWHCISDTFRYQSGCDKISFNNKDNSSDNLLFKLVKAGLRTVTGAISKKNPQKVRFNTPTATISIRGTNFEVAVPEESKKDMLRRVLITKCSKARLILKTIKVVALMLDQTKPHSRRRMHYKLHNNLVYVSSAFFNGKYDNLYKHCRKKRQIA